MRGLIFVMAGVLCSLSWLAMLVATGFAPVTVSIGLLVALFVTGLSTGSHGAV